jgi:hypothetical protein
MTDQVDRQGILADVLQLQADYARLIDAREAEPWSRLFTDDGVLIREEGPVEGRADLVTFATESPVGVHLSGVPSLEARPDGTVHATSHFVFVNSGTRRITSGTYHDTLVPGGEGLVFARREVDVRGRIEL